MNKKSDIGGKGWGDSHLWKRRETAPVDDKPLSKVTNYKCLSCGVFFRHNHNLTPDIFKAMKKAGVPDECQKKHD